MNSPLEFSFDSDDESSLSSLDDDQINTLLSDTRDVKSPIKTNGSIKTTPKKPSRPKKATNKSINKSTTKSSNKSTNKPTIKSTKSTNKSNDKPPKSKTTAVTTTKPNRKPQQKKPNEPPPRKSLWPSPLEAIIGSSGKIQDAPVIAQLVLFQNKFDELFRGIKRLAPQDIEDGIIDIFPSNDVEYFFCKLLALALNRKKSPEIGHYDRALEELNSLVSSWSYLSYDDSDSSKPLVNQDQDYNNEDNDSNSNDDNHNQSNNLPSTKKSKNTEKFKDMTWQSRLQVLHTALIAVLSESKEVKNYIRETFTSQAGYIKARNFEDSSQKPLGYDKKKSAYYFVEAYNNTSSRFRVYRYVNPLDSMDIIKTSSTSSKNQKGKTTNAKRKSASQVDLLSHKQSSIIDYTKKKSIITNSIISSSNSYNNLEIDDPSIVREWESVAGNLDELEDLIEMLKAEGSTTIATLLESNMERLREKSAQYEKELVKLKRKRMAEIAYKSYMTEKRLRTRNKPINYAEEF